MINRQEQEMRAQSCYLVATLRSLPVQGMTCHDILPPQLALGQYDSHECYIRRHAESSKSENHRRFCRSFRVTLEDARCIRCRAATEAKIRSDHSDCRPCKIKCILETLYQLPVVI